MRTARAATAHAAYPARSEILSRAAADREPRRRVADDARRRRRSGRPAYCPGAPQSAGAQLAHRRPPHVPHPSARFAAAPGPRMFAGALLLAGMSAAAAGRAATAAPSRPTPSVPQLPALPPAAALLDSADARASALPRLRSLLVWHGGRLVRERYYRGASAARPANVKSASKSIVSALVGVAIAEGALPGVRQPLGAALPAAVARAATGRAGQAEHLRAVTVEDLLTMRSGLSSTSGPFYGRWVASGDWVGAALARPVVAPAGHAGGPMIYSTGNTHVLSAVLARATGESLYRYYARALARPLGITPRAWPADARGVYFGGNEMRLTPREMVTFGRLYLEGGRAPAGTPAAGRQLVPRAWVDSSWAPRTRSPWSGEEYGYGWFLHTVAGARAAHPVRYAWGYGGQFIFVAPTLGLVMVTTSDPDAPRDPGHLGAIRAILERYVVPYAEAAAAPTTG